MSEYFNGRIVIGGVLWVDEGPESETSPLNLFLRSLADHDLGQNWIDDLVAPKNKADLLALVQDGFLEFTDSQASYGHFENLEQLCQEVNLEYDVYSDAHYEYGWQYAWHRLTTHSGECETNSAFDPITHVEPARKAYDHLRRGQVHQALTLLEQIALRNPRVEPLPPFEIRQRVCDPS